VHTIALVSVTALSLVSFVPLLVLGEPAILSANAMGVLGESMGDGSDALLTQTYTLVWIIPAAIIAVGYGLRRDFRATLSRLGLVWPTGRQIAMGIGAALLLVAAVNLIEPGMAWLWDLMGWPQTDGEAFGELMAFAFSPLGAVVIGVTAGLGEELGVRGILQPRLGIFLSNLFFTSLHALQYNWDALLVVFVLGTIFGLLRKRTNTTTSAIAHGVYNFTLVMMAIYEISLF
jgi:membrane protease YdiL (CAAX protease family)